MKSLGYILMVIMLGTAAPLLYAQEEQKAGDAPPPVAAVHEEDSASAVDAHHAGLDESVTRSLVDDAGRATVRRGARACMNCHIEDFEELNGQHRGATNPNTGKVVYCGNCHGHTQPGHIKGNLDVMRFTSDDFPLDQRNGVCMSCHEPEQLRQKLWAHDVHVTKLPCTECHKIHPSNDPMHDITAKNRVKLCADCHKKQHEAKRAKAAEATP